MYNTKDAGDGAVLILSLSKKTRMFNHFNADVVTKGEFLGSVLLLRAPVDRSLL